MSNYKLNISKILLILTLFAVRFLSAQTQPNILWLVSEDNNTGWIGCYGNEQANTPNIDKLDSEGFQYMNAFANAPVCAPQRSTWITGVNAISMGTHPMRSRNEIPHNQISYYPDELRELGYYCGNYSKTDYNIGGRNDQECWNSSEVPIWDELKQKQPFFQVINTAESHESRAKTDHDNLRHDPNNLKLHKYHPDLPEIRANYARYYDCIENMDTYIGEQLAKLEASGMAENTIVIYNSDHGGVLPRSKRFLFDTGTHSPLIIRIPNKFKHLWPADQPGTQIDRLVSFIDMPKTWISIAQGTPPKIMQGKIFLGPETEKEEDCHISFRGRMDERFDNQRAVRDKQFLYVRNYMPYVMWGQELVYLWEMKAAEIWDEYNKAGKTNVITGRFFQEKGTDELYDIVKDPDNVHNLINDPKYADVVKNMKKKLFKWQKDIYDSGLMPEEDVARRAKESNISIFELVRNPKLYNLKGYLKISNIALENNLKNLPYLLDALKNSDSGIRYWGVVGCLQLSNKTDNFKGGLSKLLNDDSHEVSALAAYALYKIGSKQLALEHLNNLLKQGSYAQLKVLNILDWINEDISIALPTIANIVADSKYIMRMQRIILTKYGWEIPEAAKRIN